MKISSSAFDEGDPIPKKHTGEGEDLSPPLRIEEVPSNAKSLVLIMDDPDAPMGTFDHWVAWDISPTSTELPEGAQFSKRGKNHFDELDYRGPLPPPGPKHRYFFKVYATDLDRLQLEEGASKLQVEEAMQGHVIDRAELMGTYQR